MLRKCLLAAGTVVLTGCGIKPSAPDLLQSQILRIEKGLSKMSCVGSLAQWHRLYGQRMDDGTKQQVVEIDYIPHKIAKKMRLHNLDNYAEFDMVSARFYPNRNLIEIFECRSFRPSKNKNQPLRLVA